jgi:hypothetical protein
MFVAVAFIPVFIAIVLILSLTWQHIPAPFSVLGIGGPARDHLPNVTEAPPQLGASVTSSPTSASGTRSSHKLLSGPPSTVLFSDDFSGPDQLITNEFATYNSDNRCISVSGKWEMNSGSLFRRGGEGYSGKPDSTDPDCTSSKSTDSDVFRAQTKAAFGNSTLSFDFTLLSHHSGNSDPSWDGIHAMIRYQSQYALYYVSVGRWDGNIVIKKKVPGGPDNGGTYYELTDYIHRPDLTTANTAHHVVITTQDDSKGYVHITLTENGQTIASAVDNGVGGPVYHSGADGIRGDYTEFEFDNFTVKAL